MRSLVALSLAAGFAACAADEPAVLAFGLEGPDSSLSYDAVRIEARIDGRLDAEGTLLASRGPVFPQAVELRSPTGHGTASIKIEIFGSASTSAAPLLVRTARANFIPGQSRLARIRLDPRCALALGGPTCDAPTTCRDGACAPDVIEPANLEPLRPTWATDARDACASGAPAQVWLGTGTETFAPLQAEQELALEAGPQGGHHLMLALRLRSFSQTTTSVTFRAEQPETHVVAKPLRYSLPLGAAGGGTCALLGLRYPLDLATDYFLFLGEPLDLSVEASDADGRSATSTVRIRVAETVLGG
jgi:hypothetical protein